MKFAKSVRLFAAASVAALFITPAAYADSGFYLGGAVGDTSIDFAGFNESDTSWKAFGGYIFDMPVVDFAVEAAYVDFGAPSNVLGEISADGLTAMGLVGLDFGLFGVFAKAGFVSWDASINDGINSASDSGSDTGYGVGFRLNFSSIEVRAEYELFQIEDADVDMASLGVLWRF